MASPGPFAPPEPSADPGPWQVVEQTQMAPPSWQVAEAPDWQPSAPTTQQPVYRYQDPGYQQEPAYEPTTAQPVYDPAYQYQQVYAPEDLRMVTPLAVASIVAGLVAAATVAVPVVAGKADGIGPSLKLRDLGENNPIVAIVIAVLAIAAAVVGAGRRRFGTGLAGGLGLGAAGWAAIIIGNSIGTLDRMERAAISTRAARFTKTFDIGFFGLAALAGLGLLLFVLSLPGSGNDGLPKLHPLATVLGVAGSVAIAAGPLIPQNGATFEANFKADAFPVITVVCRLAMLALLAFAGLAGFLNARRWGLGTALGGTAAAITLWITAMVQNHPNVIGIGIANFNGEPSKPHLVTSLGVAGVVAAAVVVLVMSQQQRLSGSADEDFGLDG